MTYEEALIRFIDFAYSQGVTTPIHEEMIATIKEALEMQMPRKPERRTHLDLDDDTVSFECPVCGEVLCEEYDVGKWIFRYDFCPACGQAIDWGVEK